MYPNMNSAPPHVTCNETVPTQALNQRKSREYTDSRLVNMPPRNLYFRTTHKVLTARGASHAEQDLHEMSTSCELHRAALLLDC